MLVFVGENMDSDRDTSLIMADAPVTPREIAGLGLDIIPASGNPGSSSDRRGETMGPSHGESEELDSNKIIVEIVSAPFASRCNSKYIDWLSCRNWDNFDLCV